MNLELELLIVNVQIPMIVKQVSKVVELNHNCICCVWQFLFSCFLAHKNRSDFQLLSHWKMFKEVHCCFIFLLLAFSYTNYPFMFFCKYKNGTLVFSIKWPLLYWSFSLNLVLINQLFMISALCILFRSSLFLSKVI